MHQCMHVPRDLGGDFFAVYLQIVRRLQVHPKTGSVLEVAGKTQRQVCRDVPSPSLAPLSGNPQSRLDRRRRRATQSKSATDADAVLQ